jgi:hypothetical protein
LVLPLVPSFALLLGMEVLSSVTEGCVASVVGAVLWVVGAVVMVLGVVVVSVVFLSSLLRQALKRPATKVKQKTIAINFFMIFLLVFVA